MWQVPKENGIMESECIIVLFVSFLEKKKVTFRSIMFNSQFI